MAEIESNQREKKNANKRNSRRREGKKNECSRNASFEHNRVLSERIPAWLWRKKNNKQITQTHSHLTSNLREHLTKIRDILRCIETINFNIHIFDGTLCWTCRFACKLCSFRAATATAAMISKKVLGNNSHIAQNSIWGFSNSAIFDQKKKTLRRKNIEIINDNVVGCLFVCCVVCNKRATKQKISGVSLFAMYLHTHTQQNVCARDWWIPPCSRKSLRLLLCRCFGYFFLLCFSMCST